MPNIVKVIEIEVKETGVDQATVDLQKLANATNEAETSSKELGEEVDRSASDFVKLERQIRKTREEIQKVDESTDKVKFDKLKAELDELEDKLEITKIKSSQFDDQLSMLPGTAGEVGNAIKSIDSTLKVLGSNKSLFLLAGSIGVIIGAFTLMRESLESTEEGQKKLSTITDRLSKLLNGLFAAIEPIAFALADFIAGILESEVVMKGITIVIGSVSGALSGFVTYLKEVVHFVTKVVPKAFESVGSAFSGLGKMIKGALTFDASLISQGFDQVVSSVNKGTDTIIQSAVGAFSNIGKSAKDAFLGTEKAVKEGVNRSTKSERDAINEAENKKRQDREKRAAEDKKIREEARKQYIEDLKAGEAVLRDVMLSLMDERSRELYVREEKYNKDKAALIKAGYSDFTQLDEAYRKDRLDINDKYTKQEADKQKEIADNIKAAAERARSEAFANEKIDLETTYAQKLISEDEYQTKLLELRKKYSDSDISIKQAELDFMIYVSETQSAIAQRNDELLADYVNTVQTTTQAVNESMSDLANNTSQLFSALAGIFKEGSDAAKAFGVLSIVVNAAQSIGEIIMKNRAAQADFDKVISQGAASIAGGVIQLAAFNPQGAGMIAAGKAGIVAGTTGKSLSKANSAMQVASVGVTSGAQIAAILSAKKSASASVGGSSAGGASVSSAAPSLPSFSQGGGAMVPQMGQTQSQTGAIAGAVSNAIRSNTSNNSPLRAYVVGSDIRTEQQLDRRISGAARLGG